MADLRFDPGLERRKLITGQRGLRRRDGVAPTRAQPVATRTAASDINVRDAAPVAGRVGVAIGVGLAGVGGRDTMIGGGGIGVGVTVTDSPDSSQVPDTETLLASPL